MKATALLESQHRRVEALFSKLEGGRGDAGALREELANLLTAHMAIEQNIFYPAIHDVDESLTLESFEEHSVAQLELKRLLAADTEHPMFAAKVTTLKELIQHHVNEEEGDLFPKVEKLLDVSTLQKLGHDMAAAFEGAIHEGYRSLLLNGIRTSADVASRRMLSDRPRAAE